MENLEKRLLQQQHENEINNQLEQLHARQVHIREHGGDEQLVNSAHVKITSDITTKNVQDELADEDATRRAFAMYKYKKNHKLEAIEIELSGDEDKKQEEGEEEEGKTEIEDESNAKQTDINEASAATAFSPKIIVKKRKAEGTAKPIETSSTKAPDAKSRKTPLSTLAGYSSDESD